MQKALQHAILQETQQDNNRNHNRKSKTKKDIKTITSGDIFSARTLESRFVLSHYNERTSNGNTVIPINRNLLRRGRSPFPKKHNKKYSQHTKKKKHKTDDLNKKKKKLLRYQKRKPFYLLQEKTKHLNSGWLNTHLWHTKRCRMGSMWSYKLALNNLQHAAKSFRNTITQLTTCCTLHDASYWNIIALHGKQNKIIDILLPFIAPFQRGSDVFTQQTVLNGYKECEIYLYKNDCYPFNFLCTVKCSWNAIQINQEDENKNNNDMDMNDIDRVCWLWCHASVYHALFKLLETTNCNDIKLRNESRKFVRYELRGPMSSFVLQAASQCFIPCLMEEKSQQFIDNECIMSSKLICDPTHYSVAQPFIWNKKIKNKAKSLQFQLKEDFIRSNIPSQHPLILINQYKANNYRMKDEFHTYFEEKNDVEMECKTEIEDGLKERKKKKIRDPLFEFPFMMIPKRYYDGNNMKDLSIRNRIIGWDIIIPIHSNILKSFKMEQPSMRFTSIARFWWNNLHFAGGRVIGYKQKVFMRLEMKWKQLLFPIDYIDSMASIHYWLKYYKYEILQNYFKKPKSKRINPYPLYPFGFWPNILYLFEDKDKIKNMELSDKMIYKNLLKIRKYDEKQLMDDDDDDDDEDDDIEMDINKQSEYLLNYTLWGFKNDCNLMNDINLNLKCDVIETFDKEWNQNIHCKYFIIRDEKILNDIKQSVILNNKIDFKGLYDWNESVINCGLILVDIKMTQKGVPTIGNPIFLNDQLFGYVIHGGYSPINGVGIGIGIVTLNKYLLIDNNNDMITICPFWNYPHQRHQCNIQIKL